MRYLSKYDFELLSQQIVNQYIKLDCLADHPIIKIDPRIMAKELFGLDIEFYEDDYFTEGFTSDYDMEIVGLDENLVEHRIIVKAKTIYLNKCLLKDNDGRLNFTIAHELAHYIIKKMYKAEDIEPSEILSNPDTNPRSSRDWDEWQANYLGAALLMPKFYIEQAMYYVGLECPIKRLSKVFGYDTYNKYCTMASVLGVSKKALEIRMLELGMIEKSYLEFPYGAIDIPFDLGGDKENATRV